MFEINKTQLALSMMLSVFCLGQAHAHTQIMDFETPIMPAAVFASQSYVQGDFLTTAITFNDATNPFSHIHGADNSGSRVSQLEADAGGGLFRKTAAAATAEGEDFSLISWDMVTLNTQITNPAANGGLTNSEFHVVGIQDGVVVADVTLDSSSAGTTIDFIALDSDFGNIDLVEYYFNPAGRGEDPAAGLGLLNQLAEIDNVTFNDAIPVVPEPETYAMLLVGLGLVGFAANRRRTYH